MEAFNAGEIEVAFAGTPEDVEFHPPAEVSEDTFNSRDEWLAFVQGLRQAHGDWRVEPREFVEPRAGVFLVRTDVQPKEPASQLPVVGEVWQVWEFGQDPPLRISEFRNRAAAYDSIGEDP
jgi:hypothetical protein